MKGQPHELALLALHEPNGAQAIVMLGVALGAAHGEQAPPRVRVHRDQRHIVMGEVNPLHGQSPVPYLKGPRLYLLLCGASRRAGVVGEGSRRQAQLLVDVGAAQWQVVEI